MKIASGWRVRGVVAVLAALVAAIASEAQAQTAEEIIARNIKAQGGRDALLNLKSLARKGEVSLDGTFGQMDGTVEEAAIPWKKARRLIDLAVFVREEGWDGKVAWADDMMGIRELEGDQADQIKQSVELNPFVKLADNKAKAEKLEDETIDDVDYFVIQIATEGKPDVKVFIDKKSDQIARVTLTQNNPMFGEIEIVAESSGYEQFGPIKLATKEKVTIGDVMEISTTYTETKVDGEIDESVFEMPKDDTATPKDESDSN